MGLSLPIVLAGEPPPSDPDEYALGVSTRHERRPSRYGLGPEDDWFAFPVVDDDEDWTEPTNRPTGGSAPFDRASRWEDDEWDEEYDDERPRSQGGFGDRRTLVLGAVGLVAVIVVAVIVVRAVGGSSGSTAATPPIDTSTTLTTTPGSVSPVTGTSGPAETGSSGATGATGVTGASGASGSAGSTSSGSQSSGSTGSTGSSGAATATVEEVPTGQSLKPGMSGSSVLALQQALAQLGYNPGTPDGSYGPSTTGAVTAFQAANSLTQDGIAGSATLTAVNEQLARG